MKPEQYISSIKRPETLYGYIVRSSISHGSIASITMPELSDDFVIITAKDIPGSNAVTVLDETFPLLSGERIIYRGQPLLAIFGPDQESVTLAASQVVITYEATDVAEIPTDTIYREKELSWGDAEALFEESEETLELAYLTGSQTSETTTPSGAFAEAVDDRIIVHASTQWPFHLRNTVSEVCGLSKRKIIVHQSSYHPTCDEKLIYPSIYAALASLATLKTGKSAKLLSDVPTYRPEMIVTRKTALSKDKSPIAETVDIQINQGAIPLFADELLEQVMTGATPMYSLKALHIRAQILVTPSPPRNHFSGLGFSLGLFTAEAHASNLALRSNMNPANWRIKYVKDSQERPKHMTKIRYGLLKEHIEQTVERSDFSRKFAVYEMQKSRQKGISTFTGYSRGIGIASGYGINGFSTSFPLERNYSVSVTLDVNDHLTIHTSLIHAHAADIWRTIAGNYLGIDPKQISIANGSTAETPNSGPDVLHRDTTVLSLLIERCCESIKNQRFKEPLPLTAKRSLKSTQNQTGRQTSQKPLFIYLSWGALAVELEIDPADLEPTILGVWGTFSCGRVYDRHTLLRDIRSTILQELTILTRHEKGIISIPEIDIQLVHQDDIPIVSPIEAIKGLLDAAYISALTQALNQEVTAIPAGPYEIYEYLGDDE